MRRKEERRGRKVKSEVEKLVKEKNKGRGRKEIEGKEKGKGLRDRREGKGGRE